MLTEEQNDVPGWALVLAGLAAIAISIVGSFGNLLSILALPYSARLRNAATWFVVNLAVLEGLFCMIILPLTAGHLFSLYFVRNTFFTNTFCAPFDFLRFFFVYAEVFSIAAIAVNRCILIAVPQIYHRIFTTLKTVAVIIVIWVLSGILMLIPLLKVYGNFAYNTKIMECDLMEPELTGWFGPKRVFLGLGFMLPCIIIVVCYSYIFYKARQSSVNVRTRSQNSQGSQLHRKPSSNSLEKRSPRQEAGLTNKDIRLARTIGVIFLTFLLCCAPVAIAHYLDSTYPIPTLLLLLHPLQWTQYCINIFVYVYMNRQYREAYVTYISRWWPNFRELSARLCQMHQKGDISTDNQRPSRGDTPHSIVSSSGRKLYKSPSFKGGAGQVYPSAGGTQSEQPRTEATDLKGTTP